MSRKNDDAFTGLEAAIVLIAFVTVAAVFSYVALGLGFFSTQKSQQVIHAGVTESVSNIFEKGEVYLIYPDGVDQVVQFDIGLAPGGSAVDVDKLQIVMSTPGSEPQEITPNYISGDLYPAPGYWSVYERNPPSKTNDLLDRGDLFTIHLTPPVTMDLMPRSRFTIELKPENGAAFNIERTIPASITNVTTVLY
jgi:archaeal flagellin FlaB